MTREERLRILGKTTVDEIHREVAAMPAPNAEQIDFLRRIFAGTSDTVRPATRGRRAA